MTPSRERGPTTQRHVRQPVRSTEFETSLDEGALLTGYAELLQEIYSVDGYYDRCERILDLAPPNATRRRPTLADVGILVRTLLSVGLFSPRRRRCWRLLTRTPRRAPHAFAWAVAQVVKGEHLIRYTDEEVVPRLRLALKQDATGADQRASR